MIRVAICDDEESICYKIEDYIKEYEKKDSKKYVVDSFCRSRDFMKNMESREKIGEEYDIVFLDIEIEDEMGHNVGNWIRNTLNNQTISIVYISSYTKYAMKLFESRPIDFIVKPINYEKIEKVLNIYNKIESAGKSSIEIKLRDKILSIETGDIIYLMSYKRKVIVVTKNTQYECYMKLDSIMLDNTFIRIHKSYIINTNYIKEYRYEEVTMKNGDVLLISKTYRKSVREMYRNRIGV